MKTPGNAVKFLSELSPETVIYIALFKDVKNADEIKQSIISGDTDAALLSPKMIVNTFQVMIAVNKALHVRKHGLKMHTRSINSEILFNLSPTNNITAAFKQFGLSGEDTSLLAVTVDDASGNKMAAIEGIVDGYAAKLDELSDFSDESLVKEVYKIPEEELTVSSLGDAVVCRIAAKEVL